MKQVITSSLFSLFGLVTADKTDYPIAALTRYADTAEQNTEWTLRCDPVCFQADMDRVVLMAHGALELAEDEAEQLLTILGAHVQQDAWQIEAFATDRWYVRGAKQTEVSTTPPSMVLGKDIKHDLPKGKDGSYWCSLMNECQMLLHDLPINQQRQAKGLLPINGLWFWGGGVLAEDIRCEYDAIYGDDHVLAGLANCAACTYEPTEKLWQAIQQTEDKKFLVVIDTLQSPPASQDLFYWIDAVKRFENEVIQLVLDLLKKNVLSQVNLLTADGRSFQLTPKRLGRWWRRGRQFHSLLAEAGD